MPEDTIATRIRLDGQAQYSAGAKKASDSVSGIGKSAEESSKQSSKASGMTASGLLKAAAAAGVTYKAWQGLKSSVSTTVDLAKSTATLKRVTGLDAKQAQAWSLVTKERGIETKQLQMGMTTLGRTLGGLGGPTKQTDKALAQVGLTSKQLNALPTDQRMLKIADAFKQMPDGVNKAALAQKLFGRSGQALLPLLNSGSKGLQEQLDAANKLVPPLGNSGKAALDLAKKQRELKMATTGVKVAVGSALLPVLSTLVTMIAPIVTGFASLLTSCKPLTYVILGLATAVAAIVLGVKAWTIAQAAFNAVMSANPIILVVVAIAALAAGLVIAYQKIGWFRAGVDAMANAAVAAFNWLKNAAVAVFNWIKGNWPLLLGILGGPIGAAVAIIITHFDKIKGAAQSVWNFLKGLGSFIGGAFTSAWSGAAGVIRSVASAIQSVIDTAKKIASLPGKAGDLISKGLGAAGSVVGLQHGGTVLQAGSAIVGEAGPELVTLPVGAQVTPLPAVSSMSAMIQVPVYLDTRQIGMAVGTWNSDQAARKGKATT